MRAAAGGLVRLGARHRVDTDAMRPCVLGVLSAVATVAGLLAPPAHAYPRAIDFDALPTVNLDDYLLGNAYVGYGFRTADGFRCKASTHMSMSAVDCVGPFVDAPGGGDAAHLFANSPHRDASPVSFHHNAASEWSTDPTAFDGHPLTVLPAGVTFAAPNVVCAHTVGIALACWIGSAAEGNGFVATATGTSVAAALPS